MAWPTTDSAAAAPLGHQACFVPRTRWKLIYSHFSRIMSTHQSASSGIAASFKLMHKTHAYDWLLFVVRSSQVQWWWCSERSKVYFRLLGKMIELFVFKKQKRCCILRQGFSRRSIQQEGIVYNNQFVWVQN